MQQEAITRKGSPSPTGSGLQIFSKYKDIAKREKGAAVLGTVHGKRKKADKRCAKLVV